MIAGVARENASRFYPDHASFADGVTWQWRLLATKFIVQAAGCRLIKQKPSNAWHTLSLIVFSPAFNDKHPSAENPFHSVHTGESANLYRHRLNYSVSKNRLSMGAPDDVSIQCQPPWVHSANIKDTSFTVLGTVNPLDIRFDSGMSIAFYVLHGLAIAVRSPFKLDDICWMHPVC